MEVSSEYGSSICQFKSSRSSPLAISAPRGCRGRRGHRCHNWLGAFRLASGCGDHAMAVPRKLAWGCLVCTSVLVRCHSGPVIRARVVAICVAARVHLLCHRMVFGYVCLTIRSTGRSPAARARAGYLGR